MALMTCEECGNQLSTQANACPSCGAKNQRFKWWLWIPLSAIVGFLGVGFVAGNSPQAKEKAQQRAAIEHCWDTQADKSLAPGAARFAAGACVMLEDRFRKRWGVNP